MNWKRNPNLVIGLCAALGVSVIVIMFLLYRRRNSSQTEEYPVQPQGPPAHAPPQMEYRRPPPPPPTAPSPPHPETAVGGGSGKPALVMFYAEWCGHSKAMQPSWQQLQQTLAQTNQFDLVAIDADKNKEEMGRHGVRGFPTVRYYPQGFPGPNHIEYKGNRTVDSLMKFVRSGGQES